MTGCSESRAPKPLLKTSKATRMPNYLCREREKAIKAGRAQQLVQFLSRMVQACSLHAASGSVQPSYHVPSALGRSTSHHKLRDTQPEAPLGPAEQQARFLGTVCVRISSPGQLAQCWFSAELNPRGASQHTWHCAWIRG